MQKTKGWKILNPTLIIVLLLFAVGFFYTVYDDYQRSPEYDPVTFDLTDKADVNTAIEKNNIFYIPFKYLDNFSNGYKDGNKGYLIFDFDFDNPSERDFAKMKNYIKASLDKPGNYGARYKIFNNQIKNIEPKLIENGITSYEERIVINSSPEAIHTFKGYDGEKIIIVTHLNSTLETLSKRMDIYRSFNANLELHLSVKFHPKEQWFELDKKLTMYIKNLQTPPTSFKKLK